MRQAPSYFLFVQPWMVEMEKKTLGLWNGVLIIDANTGERDYSHFGTYAAEFKRRWEEYESAK